MFGDETNGSCADFSVIQSKRVKAEEWIKS